MAYPYETGIHDHICPQLRNRWLGGLDVLAIDIQRGRDHGLPGYTQYRVLCGLSHVTSFQHLADTMPQEVCNKITLMFLLRGTDGADWNVHIIWTHVSYYVHSSPFYEYLYFLYGRCKIDFVWQREEKKGDRFWASRFSLTVWNIAIFKLVFCKSVGVFELVLTESSQPTSSIWTVRAGSFLSSNQFQRKPGSITKIQTYLWFVNNLKKVKCELLRTILSVIL